MVKTRTNQTSCTETEPEIQTEYSEDFESDSDAGVLTDERDATVLKMPTRSQSTSVFTSTQTRSKVTKPSRQNRPLLEQIDKSGQIEYCLSEDKKSGNGEMFDALAVMMKSIIKENEKSMRSMTETLLERIEGTPRSKTKKPVRSSSRRILRSRRFPSPIDESSSDESDDSQFSSDEELQGKQKKNLNTGSRLPAFTGKEKWKVWFNRFEAVANIYGWSKKEKLAELLPRLQGIAGDFVYDQLSTEVTSSYRRLVRELDSRFKEVDTTKIYITKLHNRRQLEDESIQEYAAELKRLYDKGFPKRDKTTRQEDLLRQYLIGLQDEGARQHIELNKEPKTIDEAVYHTIHYQETCGYPYEMSELSKGANYRHRRQVRQIKHTEPVREVQKDRQTTWQSNEGRRCFNCNELGHFSRQCTRPRRQLSRNHDGPKTYDYKSSRRDCSTRRDERYSPKPVRDLNPLAPSFAPSSLN